MGDQLRDDIKRDWDWADLHLPTTFNILRKNASYLVQFEIAPRKVDLEEVGDVVLSSNMGHIALRVRESGYFDSYRDFTIRSKRSSGVPTEIDKIREGKGKWYFYAWSNLESKKLGKLTKNPEFRGWILVDLDEFRQSGLVTSYRRHIPNQDGGQTWFYAYSINELNFSNCLVATSNNLLDNTLCDFKHNPLSFTRKDFLEAAAHAEYHSYYNE